MILVYDCPHCGGGSMTFTGIDDARFERTGTSPCFDVFCRCNRCLGTIIAHLECNEINMDSPMRYNAPCEGAFWVVSITPKPKANEAPQYTPPNVARPFIQALDNLRRSNWDAAGTMCRKALDVGTQVMDPALKPLTLYKRIENLHETGRITADLKEWAHHIRVNGNDAAHDEDEFTEDEAKDLMNFTDMLLQYLFTMPGMLAERRNGVAT